MRKTDWSRESCGLHRTRKHDSPRRVGHATTTLTERAIANELHEKLRKGESAAVLEQVLKALIDYTTYHFHTEEKLMAAVDYPRYRQHKAEHDGFLDTVLNLQGRFRRGDSFVAESVLGVLKDWLFNHVQTVDKYLAVFLQSHHEDSVSTRLEIAYSEIKRLSNIIRFAIPRPFLNRLMAHQSSTDDNHKANHRSATLE